MITIVTAAFVVFVAELGDKTMLAAAGFGARYRTAPVALGVFFGYAAVNALSALVGGIAGASLPLNAVRAGAGVVFLVAGVYTVLSIGDDEADTVADERRSGSVVVLVASTIFMAELGDKTMLATISLAASANPVLVWVGATVGITASGLLAVTVGHWLSQRVAARTQQLVSGWLFVVVGLLTIATVAL